MQSSDGTILTFGVMNTAVAYTPRSAAYAVIMDQQGRIAAVTGNQGYFLPGGGSLPDETPEQTIRREVKEELAHEVRIVSQIGEAVQYFFADQEHYRMEAHFFAAEFVGGAKGTGEHELHWLAAETSGKMLYHESLAWAVSQGRSSTG
jgi:8-oxo-dGTP pyrophosphatase MutT (NUDIX family)